MSWEEVELRNVCELKYGKNLPASKRKEGNVSVFSSAGNIDTHNEAYIKTEGIIIGRKGSIGKVYYSAKEFYPIDTCYYIEPNESYNLKFLYYNLFTLGLDQLNTDAAVPGLNRENAYSQIIHLPPLPTQKKIADILSAYDDLIENNLKRIKLLEEAAQNIYKEWFVNFRFPNHENTPIDDESGLPVGWKKSLISDELAKVKRNGKLKKDDYQDKGKYPIIDQADGLIAGYTDNEEVVNSQQLPIVIFGDHTRRVKYINFPFVSGADGTQLVYPKNEKLNPSYWYLAINSIDLSNYAYARHYKYLKEQIIFIPTDDILKEFNSLTIPMLDSIIQLGSYNNSLKEARDILLPRLMNRTIEV